MINNTKVRPQKHMWKIPQVFANKPDRLLGLTLGACEKVA